MCSKPSSGVKLLRLQGWLLTVSESNLFRDLFCPSRQGFSVDVACVYFIGHLPRLWSGCLDYEPDLAVSQIDFPLFEADAPFRCHNPNSFR